MADDKSKTGGQGRSRVAGDQEYELRYFAEINSAIPDQAREVIQRCGRQRDMLEREVNKPKASA